MHPLPTALSPAAGGTNPSALSTHTAYWASQQEGLCWVCPVAISFPRYSKRVIKAVEFAKRAGADVVALTDSADAPIAHSAQQVLIAQSDMASYVDSLVAPLSLLNAIIVAVSRARETEVRERLEKLEHIWDEYDVYDKNQG